MKDYVENNKCLTSTCSTEKGEDMVQNKKKSGIKLISYKAKKSDSENPDDYGDKFLKIKIVSDMLTERQRTELLRNFDALPIFFFFFFFFEKRLNFLTII